MQDNDFSKLINDALKKINTEKNIKPITKEEKQRLEKIKDNLLFIAKENQAQMTIKNPEYFKGIVIELESDVIDLDNDKIKNSFIGAIMTSKSVTIESRTNGKFAIIAEIHV